MKRIALLILITLALFACEKDPITGDLLITVEYDGYAEKNVEVWLFDSRYAFDNFEYLEKQLSDENGEVFWGGLKPGRYYFEAEITKPVNFHLYAVDSTDVSENAQKNKRLILQID
ncbi:hypothetical protein ACFLTA_02585 [Bacteroidota bacterium]